MLTMGTIARSVCNVSQRLSELSRCQVWEAKLRVLYKLTVTLKVVRDILGLNSEDNNEYCESVHCYNIPSFCVLKSPARADVSAEAWGVFLTV